MKNMFWFLLSLLLFHQGACYFSGTPRRWVMATQQNCDGCSFVRDYSCGGPKACNKGVYADYLYKTAFTSKCFGVNFFQNNAANRLLRNLKNQNANWRTKLKSVIDDIYNSGLWSNLYFSTTTPCEPQVDNSKSRQTRSIRVNEKQPIPANLLVHRNRLGRQGRNFRPRFTSVLQFHCPVNRSLVWRKQLRYCQEDDRVYRTTKCKCTPYGGFKTKTEICLNEFGFEDASRCNRQPRKLQCECPSSTDVISNRTSTTPVMTSEPQTATTSQTTNSNSQTNCNTTIFVITASTKTADNTTTARSNRRKRNRSRAGSMQGAVIALCIALFILICATAGYCAWRIFRKLRSKMEWNTLHMANDNACHGQALPTAQDATGGYLSVGDSQESSVYQTIEARGIKPAIPPRLFSIASSVNSSRTTSVSSRPCRPNALSISTVAYTKPTSNASPNDGGYASIDGKSEANGSREQEDQMYDIPPDSLEQENQNENIYVSPSSEIYSFSVNPEPTDVEVRVNPLYSRHE